MLGFGGGDFDALVAMLDPRVVPRADGAAVRAGAAGEVRGAAEVAATSAGPARATQRAPVSGAVGAVWSMGGRPRVVFGFTVTHAKIVRIDLLADPERLGELDVAVLEE